MKKMNLFNKALIFASVIINTICLVLTLIGKYDSNILVCLSYYVLVLVPFILKKLKVEINNYIQTMYLIFIIIACLLGSIFHFYGKIYWYDSLVHYISGILSAFLGLIFLVKFDKYKEKEIVFNIVYIIFTTLSVAVLWEVFEFTADNLLNGDAQKVLTTGVTDTMKDMICALLGSILVSFIYAYEYINKKKLIVYNFIKSI